MATARGNIAGLVETQEKINKLATMPNAINQKKRMAKLLADRKMLAADIVEDDRP